jgi:general secretion pathway protein L
MKIKDFWAWWRSEVAGMIPARDPRHALNRKSRTEVVVDRQGLRVFGKQRLTAPLNDRSPNAGLEKLQSLRRGEKVVLTLDEGVCFVRRTSIPQAAEQHASQILDLELARVLPVSSSDVVKGWYRTATGESGKIGAVQVVARKSLIAEASETLRKSGARIVGIAFRSSGGEAFPLVLTREGTVFGAVSENRWKAAATIAGASLLLAAAFVGYSALGIQNRDRLAIEIKTAEVQKPATEIRRQIEATQAQSKQTASLFELRQKQPSILACLEELSRLLPDKAWVQTVSISERTVQIEGSAMDAEALIKVLDASALFANPRFSSPLIKNPGEPQIRFSIALDLEGQGS